MVRPSRLTHLLNASDFLSVDCFSQNPSSQPQLRPLTFTTCRQAVQRIHLSEKASAPITFSHDPDAGFRVPYSWSYGDCVVRIDIVEADAEETTTFAEVFMAGIEIAIDCVIKPPHLGGKSKLGRTQMLEMAIIESSIRESP